jgi:hypothetical protein
MKPRPKAIIDQLLARIRELEDHLTCAESMLAMWERGSLRRSTTDTDDDTDEDMPEVEDLWNKIRGRKQ